MYVPGTSLNLFEICLELMKCLDSAMISLVERKSASRGRIVFSGSDKK